MNKRTCEGCRFYAPAGACWRYPTAVETLPNASCGEWRDKAVTPEMDERRELVRRFVVALAGTDNYGVDKVWEWAEKLADAEPNIPEAKQ
jgi:hypothetical protein